MVLPPCFLRLRRVLWSANTRIYTLVVEQVSSTNTLQLGAREAENEPCFLSHPKRFPTFATLALIAICRP